MVYLDTLLCSSDIREVLEYKDELFELVLGGGRVIPDTMCAPEDGCMTNFHMGMNLMTACRERYIRECGFVFLSWDWINPFVEWINGRKCLEIMCGTGALSWSLQSKGVDIIPTDNFSWKNMLENSWTTIEELDALSAIDTYGKDVDIVVVSWIPLGSDLGYESLKRLYEVNPNAIMVVIGEGEAGCTSNEKFFDSLEVVEDTFFEDNVEGNYKTWWGLHDYPMIVRYKNEGGN